MTFDEVLAKVIELLQREGKVSYRALKRRFELDDEYLEDLKAEIIDAKRLAADEDGKVLAWIGDVPSTPTSSPTMDHDRSPLSYTPKHLTDKILASRSALEGERKLVSVLFADVGGFTTISERLGPEEVHELMDGCFERLTETVHRYEGTVNQYTGDGIMALFGAPIAHEDHPLRALLAALAIQEAMHTYGERLQREKAVDFRLRIGVNTGLVVVGRIGDNLRMDYTAQGDTTNLAARLQTLAEPGTILASEHTHSLTQGYFTFVPLGERTIKGRSPVRVFQVTGRRAGRARIDIAAESGLTTFVGRRRELELLEELLAKAAAGHGQVIGVVGEPGVGKSRLLLEFRRSLEGENVIYLEGRCLSYGQSIPYLPIVDVLKGYFSLDVERVQTISESVVNQLGALGLQSSEMAASLSTLLSGQVEDGFLKDLPPEVRRKKTFEALRSLFLAISHRRPLVLVVEDLHWVDQPSEAFLTFLGESLGAAPLMLILMYRPGYTHKWAEKSYYSQITVHPLTDAESGTLIASVLGGIDIPQDLMELINRKGEGNPLYVEEITKSFLDRRIIEREGAGYRLTRAITPEDVPETIQDVIVSRIDRLQDDEKRTIQTAAVIGREFPARLLENIADVQGLLEDCLRELKKLEFVYEKSFFPDLEYMFKHLLTQEAAYSSLLSTRRRRLHTAIGLAMEGLYQDRLAERYEELAHHFTQGETWEKAFHYLLKSGDKARQVCANHEAITFYSQAIEVSAHIQPPSDKGQLLPVYEGRGLVWMLLTKYDEAIADFRMMLELARASANQRQEGESLCHLASAHWYKFSEDLIPLVEQYAEEALRISQEIGDEKIHSRSLAVLGLVQQERGNLQEADGRLEESLQICRNQRFKGIMATNLMWLSAHSHWQGKFLRAIELGEEGLAISQETHDGLNELLCIAFLCLSNWSVGKYSQALRLLHEGIRKAKERNNKFILGRLTNTLGWFHREFGDPARAVEYDRESVDLGRTYRISNVEISALINLGLDYAALGELGQAVSVFEPTLDRIEREGFGAHKWRWKTKLLLGLAEAHHARGEGEVALPFVEEGLQEAQKTSSQKYVAQGWALRAKILEKLGKGVRIEGELQRALALAEGLGGPALSYPLAYELGQWYETTGKEREAATLYAKAKDAIGEMVGSVDDQSLRSSLLQSERVQVIYESVARLSGRT